MVFVVDTSASAHFESRTFRVDNKKTNREKNERRKFSVKWGIGNHI